MSPPAHMAGICMACLALGTCDTPHHRGECRLCIGTPDVPGWLLRYLPASGGPAIESPVWDVPRHPERALRIGLARAVSRGLIAETAIPPIRDLHMLNQTEPLPGFTLRSVVITAEPPLEYASYPFGGWQFAEITAQPAATLRRAAWRASSSDDDDLRDALTHAIILAASDHPGLRRLAITHALHGSDFLNAGLRLMFAPWE